ncbi:hypothetical protein WME98_32255 [Sorangium sp. So ce296]|uniref:hypothetical protein n=1 Tax=Sorangium sp. So ce296 TaxID=3133296 RepID=UPI003F5F66BC
MSSKGDYIYLQRAAVRAQIRRSFATAQRGVQAQTVGTTKFAQERLRETVRTAGVGGADRGLVSDLRQKSRIGVNHKESVAVLAADMRGSSTIADENEPDDVFVLIQCFIPLLAFVVRELRGEVVGLRGDGLIAAFGFGESAWYSCVLPRPPKSGVRPDLDPCS